MGIFYMTGAQLPVSNKIGPSDAILLEQKEGDPVPTVGFATSNPPISSHLEMIQSLLRYLLETNNLSYAGADQGGSSAQSGIQEILQMSENIEDIEDQRELYRDREPLILKKIIKWINLYNKKNLLEDSWKELGAMNPDMDVAIKFTDAQPYISEKEKLENIEKRMEIGLDTMVDAIKKDNPDLTDKQAKEKLAEILKEKAERVRENMKKFGANDGSKEDIQEDQDNKSESNNPAERRVED